MNEITKNQTCDQKLEILLKRISDLFSMKKSTVTGETNVFVGGHENEVHVFLKDNIPQAVYIIGQNGDISSICNCVTNPSIGSIFSKMCQYASKGVVKGDICDIYTAVQKIEYLVMEQSLCQSKLQPYDAYSILGYITLNPSDEYSYDKGFITYTPRLNKYVKIIINVATGELEDSSDMLKVKAKDIFEAIDKIKELVER
ncbi:MAG: hypothetical protein ACRC0G_07505 [Fusobacteriaceae bacterium]